MYYLQSPKPFSGKKITTKRWKVGNSPEEDLNFLSLELLAKGKTNLYTLGFGAPKNNIETSHKKEDWVDFPSPLWVFDFDGVNPDLGLVKSKKTITREIRKLLKPYFKGPILLAPTASCGKKPGVYCRVFLLTQTAYPLTVKKALASQIEGADTQIYRPGLTLVLPSRGIWRFGKKGNYCKLRKTPPSNTKAKPRPIVKGSFYWLNTPEKYLQFQLDKLRKASKGERNATLFKVAAKVYSLVKYSGQDIRAVETLEKTAEEIGLGSEEIATTCASAKQHIKPLPNDEIYSLMSPGFRPPGDLAFATAILERQDSPVIFDGNNFFVYSNKKGFWQVKTDNYFKSIILNLSGLKTAKGVSDEGEFLFAITQLSMNTRSSILDAIKILTFKKDFFDEHKPGIVFKNGFFEKSTLKLARHSPDNRALWGFDFDYDLDVDFKDSRIVRFLEEGLPSDEDRTFLCQTVGQALLGERKRATIILGKPGSGKSTLLRVIQSLFPADSVAHTEPQDFGSYQLAGLVGKSVNICYDLSPNFINKKAESQIKKVIFHEPVEARQIRQEAFVFTPRAAHYFAMNELPEHRVNSSAFFDRFDIIAMNRIFRGTDKEDPDLFDKITTKHEIQTFVMYSMVKYLFEPFARPQNSLIEKWANSDPISEWLFEENIKPYAGEGSPIKVKRQDLFNRYCLFCEQANQDPMGRNGWIRRMETRGFEEQRTANARYIELAPIDEEKQGKIIPFPTVEVN